MPDYDSGRYGHDDWKPKPKRERILLKPRYLRFPDDFSIADKVKLLTLRGMELGDIADVLEADVSEIHDIQSAMLSEFSFFASIGALDIDCLRALGKADIGPYRKSSRHERRLKHLD